MQLPLLFSIFALAASSAAVPASIPAAPLPIAKRDSFAEPSCGSIRNVVANPSIERNSWRKLPRKPSPGNPGSEQTCVPLGLSEGWSDTSVYEIYISQDCKDCALYQETDKTCGGSALAIANGQFTNGGGGQMNFTRGTYGYISC